MFTLAGIWFSAPYVWADEAPEFITFDGTDSLTFPATASINLLEIATIEFWVKPEWDEPLGYDPVILSALGPAAPRYAIAMSDQKNAIGLYSGEDWDFTEFDFSDGKPHHVAFVILGDLTDIYIDGKSYDAIAQGIALDIDALTFHIGSIDGFTGSFIGEMAGIRLWDAALEEDEIKQYSQQYIMDEAAFSHPDYSYLIGASDFQESRRSFTLMELEDDDDLESLVEIINPVETDTEVYSPEFLAGLEAPVDPSLLEEEDDPVVEAWFEDDADVFEGLEELAATLETQGITEDNYTIEDLDAVLTNSTKASDKSTEASDEK